jgi:PIN domain nuclease of toxin-antitoxin system
LNLLLDTCAVIFIAQDPNRLSKPTRDLVVDAANAVFVSVVTGGELACLADRKKVILPQHWKAWFRDCIERNGWNLLPLTIDIMEEAYSLPDPIHRDPVDRILIATSRTEEMTLVTTDRLILEYPHVAARG